MTVSAAFPSASIVAFLAWPFLASWLLMAVRGIAEFRKCRLYAAAGIVLGWGGLAASPPNLDPVQYVFLGVATLFPAILLYSPYRQQSLMAFDDKTGQGLLFWVAGCVLMAGCLCSLWAVLLFLCAGFVLLAWWDGRRIQRAMAAWQFVRPRLCGIILASAGAALLQEVAISGGDHAGTAGMFHDTGSLFLVAGLGLIAGLGRVEAPVPGLGLFDTGLRFAALMVMMRLSSPLVGNAMLVAALGSVAIVTFTRTSVRIFFCFWRSFLIAMGAVAASCGQANALLWCFLAAILTEITALEGELPSEQHACFQAVLLSVAGIIVIMLGQVLVWEVVAFLLVCLLCPVLRNSRKREIWNFWPAHRDGFDIRKDHDAWGRLMILLFFILTGSGIFVISWRPVLFWIL